MERTEKIRSRQSVSSGTRIQIKILLHRHTHVVKTECVSGSVPDAVQTEVDVVSGRRVLGVERGTPET